MSQYEEALKCPISGATSNLFLCCPMTEVVDEKDSEYGVACKEWIFGLHRGGLSYYLQSRENSIWFREDICRMYSRMEFILVPTFKTFVDMMTFIQRAGLTGRKEDDQSARRPLTALASNRGAYRYVFMPFTDAARELQKEFKMAPQTLDDLNNNWHPLFDEPLMDGSDAYPVVECHTHPFSVSTFADKAFWRWSTLLIAQWHTCADELVDQWRLKEFTPPKWFVDAPRIEQDDTDLSITEAAGYDPFTSEDAFVSGEGDVLRESDADAIASDPRTKVKTWFGRVDFRAKPIEEELHPLPHKLRRSSRIAARSSPYARASSPAFCTPPYPKICVPSSPVRRAPWPSARGRDPIHYPPAWAKRNGRFPTAKFSSNDWAYFQYSVALATRTDG
ncbi:hypothetical protein BD626DRAFT_405900 [Schizophyllum amplum]|uniref:Uncharacterized protein n=1 Tax=Schizophyllum amplum TaxID=97359 RepID=A0A550C919_9AGAR|nr:hypothetical protein BD626DRAFT_405900 [Auriculariopsis ampla]